MNKYSVAIYHYFKGYQTFVIEAKNKAEKYGSGNYNINDAKIIKKLRKK